MFSGIVQDTAVVAPEGGEHRLALISPLFERAQPPLSEGDSVAVAGVCLTVTEVKGPHCHFDLASETRRATTLGDLRAGSRVNVELPTKLGDRLHGHLVSGHVDLVVALLERREDGNNTVRLEFELPRAIAPFIAPKGSVTIDGVSLTVGEVEAATFSVYVIPHTLAVTTLGELMRGARVNIEVDQVARYVKRAMEYLVR